MVLDCGICGKSIHRSPSQVRKNNFCSKACADEFLRGGKSSRARCNGCGADLHRSPSRQKRATFCSKLCHDNFQRLASGNTDTSRRCGRCGQHKPLAEFVRDSTQRQGRSYTCKPCRAEYDAHRRSSPDIAERQRAFCRRYYYKDPERSKRRSKEWYQKNPERHRVAANRRSRKLRRVSPEFREKTKLRVRAWRRRNPDKTKIQKHKRRTREAGPHATHAEWLERVALFSGRCAYCGKRCLRPTMDHMVPVSRGGSGNAENLIPSCGPCNFSKQARTLEEWLRLLVDCGDTERSARVMRLIENGGTCRPGRSDARSENESPALSVQGSAA